MQSSDAKFAGSIPELYERYLGALLFEPYAEDLLQRLSSVRTGTVVEVAAGTGVVTRVLRKGLPADFPDNAFPPRGPFVRALPAPT